MVEPTALHIKGACYRSRDAIPDASMSLNISNLLISSPKNANKAHISDNELFTHLHKKKAAVRILEDYLTCERGPFLWANEKGGFQKTYTVHCKPTLCILYTLVPAWDGCMIFNGVDLNGIHLLFRLIPCTHNPS